MDPIAERKANRPMRIGSKLHRREASCRGMDAAGRWRGSGECAAVAVWPTRARLLLGALCAAVKCEFDDARYRQHASATDYGRVMTSLGPAGSRNVTPRS